MFKNGCGLLGHGTLKSAVSEVGFDELSWLFAWWYKFQVTFILVGDCQIWACFLDNGTLK